MAVRNCATGDIGNTFLRSMTENGGFSSYWRSGARDRRGTVKGAQTLIGEANGEHRSHTMDMQEKPPCAIFNKVLPMSSDKSVIHVPGLDLFRTATVRERQTRSSSRKT